jgi:hypothetical protein
MFHSFFTARGLKGINYFRLFDASVLSLNQRNSLLGLQGFLHIFASKENALERKLNNIDSPCGGFMEASFPRIAHV